MSPLRDGSGPAGQGPRTGRGLGNCKPGTRTRRKRKVPAGAGRGQGFGGRMNTQWT